MVVSLSMSLIWIEDALRRWHKLLKIDQLIYRNHTLYLLNIYLTVLMGVVLVGFLGAQFMLVGLTIF